jgi:hypothetical protein
MAACPAACAAQQFRRYLILAAGTIVSQIMQGALPSDTGPQPLSPALTLLLCCSRSQVGTLQPFQTRLETMVAAAGELGNAGLGSACARSGPVQPNCCTTGSDGTTALQKSKLHY